MTPTTVLLADLPPMLEDIVFHLLRDRADLRIIRGSVARAGILAAAAGAQRVIVMRRDPADFAALDEGLGRAAGLTVLALNPDAAWGCLHTLQPHATRIEDISAAQLLAAMAIAVPAGRA